MKALYIISAALFLASEGLCRVYAIELCEPQDAYNLANAAKCPIPDNKAGDKHDPRDAMFEIMKNYPFESKDSFVKFLQRKVEIVDNSITQQQNKRQTEEVKADISKLEQTKQSLSEQSELVIAATPENWGSVRDQARQALEEAARRLREVE